MLDFTGFKNEFISSCKNRLALCDKLSDRSNTMIEERLVTKAQRGELTSLIFRAEGSCCAPTVYVEDFYEMYRKGRSLEELSNAAVVNIYPYIDNAPDFSGDAIDDPVNLRVRLINISRNRDYLRTVPYIDEGCGLALIAEIRSGEFRAVITNDLLRSMDLSKDDLFKTAIQNTAEMDDPVLYDLSELLIRGRDDCTNYLRSLQDMMLLPGPAMFVLSNRDCWWGAASLFYPGLAAKLEELMNGPFYVLPSSVHEVLLLPKSLGDPQELTDTIRSANRSVVDQDEFLSDDLYLCRSGKLTRVNCCSASSGGALPS